ncbi:MAG: hypothetical protein VX733_06990 [Candidatus Latescibacterota bacterium]|nr:hypothetical protein [Candidatus Latescibacterota bacterium]
MHSSVLRGEDFRLQWRGVATPHCEFFAGLQPTDRLGVFAPGGSEGAGAATLILAYVTGFYDRYREQGEEFFAYPDYYSFQCAEALRPYSMFDIWPEHKNVAVSDDPKQILAAICDRAVQVLLVPDGEQRGWEMSRELRASVERLVRRCWLYDASGKVSGDADLEIETAAEPIGGWIQVDSDGECSDDRLRQTFREIHLEEAIRYL